MPEQRSFIRIAYRYHHLSAEAQVVAQTWALGDLDQWLYNLDGTRYQCG